TGCGAAVFSAGLSAGFAAGLAAAAAGGVAERFFSTTTALVRPWLKLCLTVEVSVFFSDSVLPGRLVSSVSLMNLFRCQNGLKLLRKKTWRLKFWGGSPKGVPRQRSDVPRDRPAGRRHVSHSRVPAPSPIRR